MGKRVHANDRHMKQILFPKQKETQAGKNAQRKLKSLFVEQTVLTQTLVNGEIQMAFMVNNGTKYFIYLLTYLLTHSLKISSGKEIETRMKT
jgi:hypothetical protein